MNPGRIGLIAGGVLLVLLAGALGLRALLLDTTGREATSLSWIPLRPVATASSTPFSSTRYVEQTATSVAAASPSPTSPARTRAFTYLPMIEQQVRPSVTPPTRPNPESPTQPNPEPPTRLTPEPLTATAESTYTPIPRETAPPTYTPRPILTLGPPRPTKLGVGVYESGGAMLPDLEVTRPSVILLMDPTDDFAREVRRMFPKAFIMGRIYEKDQLLDNPEARGSAFADRVAQKAVPLKGVVDAWMGYNEITGHKDYDNYRAYNRFQVAFARRLQGQYDIPAVAANDATGTVEPADYVRYFAEAIRESKYFGVHSYAPNGVKSMRDPTGFYLVLRHREIKAALDAAGVTHGPFIITESGLWDGFVGFASEESMADDYIWFAEELNKDPYVLGTTIFGIFRGAEDWRKFNVAKTSIAERIGQYNSQGWR